MLEDAELEAGLHPLSLVLSLPSRYWQHWSWPLWWVWLSSTSWCGWWKVSWESCNRASSSKSGDSRLPAANHWFSVNPSGSLYSAPVSQRAEPRPPAVPAGSPILCQFTEWAVEETQTTTGKNWSICTFSWTRCPSAFYSPFWALLGLGFFLPLEVKRIQAFPEVDHTALNLPRCRNRWSSLLHTSWCRPVI